MGTWLAEHALATVITILGGVIATFLSKKTGNILDAIEEKAHIDIDDKLEVRIQNIVRKVVMAVSQTYVKGLKKSGKFDSKAKKEALSKAASEVGSLIGKELGIKLEKKGIELAVEAEIGEMKEVEKVIGGTGGAQGFAKKKKK